MLDIAIIGAGIFGRTIGYMLQTAGMNVQLFDSNEKGAGSKPAGCLIKPSWLRAIPPAEYEKAMFILEGLWGVQQLEFYAGTRLMKKRTDVYWVDPDTIMGWMPMNPIDTRTVVMVENTSLGGARITLAQPGEVLEEVYARRVIVAAGGWAPQIVPWMFKPEDKAHSKSGMAVRFKPFKVEYNDIQVWAPYKQLVRYQMPERYPSTVWCGDGQAILTERYRDEHRDASMKRIVEYLGAQEVPFEQRIGARPYVANLEGNPCLLRTEKHVSLVTGGAKNGTIAAGWAAGRLLAELA